MLRHLMIRKISAGIPFYEFEIFQQFRGGLEAAVFTRHSDISTPSAVQTVFETDARPITFQNQLHGTRISHVIHANTKTYEGDVFITQIKNTPLLIRIADCASILLFDPTKKVIANIHAGWRGLAKKIVARTIQELVRRFEVRPENIFAGISPMIGSCCCRFTEPKKELPKFLHAYILEKNLVDLWSAAEDQLHGCGIPENQIENPHLCTFCNPEDFFSYRREGDSGRFGTAIMLK